MKNYCSTIKRAADYLFFCILFTACESDFIKHDSIPVNPIQKNTNIRSFDEAYAIAKSAISMFSEDDETRAIVNYEHWIDKDNSIVITGTGQTRAANDTLLYVFNFSDDHGFAVIAADASTQGLIAITDKGDYLSAVSEIPAFSNIMKKVMENDRSSNLIPVLEPIDTSVVGIVPKISVAWGQQYPEGTLFSNGISGCSNTAIAQIASYYKYPLSITYEENNQRLLQNLLQIVPNK